MYRSGPTTASIVPPRRRPRQRLIGALVLVLAMLVPSAAGAATSIGSPATLDELVTSAAYDVEHADVLRLYLAFFEREPDPTGAAYWIQQYENGPDLDDLAWGFSNSTEFINRYGASLDNRAFLEIVYGNVLGRAPDAGGLDYWVGELEKGLTQHGVVRWVAANDEFIANHPYAPGFVPLTEAMFLGTGDFPSDWTAFVANAEPPGDLSVCENGLHMPEGSIVLEFKAADQTVVVNQVTMPFGSVAGAEAYLDRVRAHSATCPAYRSSDGFDRVTSALPMRNVGDSSASRLTNLTTVANGSTGVEHLVAWRMGRLLTVVTIGAATGLATSEINRLVDLAEPRMRAGLS